MPRSLKSLAQYARTGKFRAERHSALLEGSLVGPEELRRIQAAYQQAETASERAALAREFERTSISHAATEPPPSLLERVRDMSFDEFCRQVLGVELADFL